MRNIVIGSRKSELALTQTGTVVESLKQVIESQGQSSHVEVRKMETKGDKILDVMLSKVGGKGLFVKEIEQAMLHGDIDMAVHSMKDVPSKRQEGLTLAAVTKREDARDVMVSRHGLTLDELPEGAKVGTSSLRRSCQLLAYRPDLQIAFVRGNIGTRISKLETEGFDAIILAAAGLIRVGWADRISQYLPVELSLPAVGQGALGLECRSDDVELLAVLDHLNDPETASTVSAERSFLAMLDGSCQVPIGAYGEWTGRQKETDQPEIKLTGLVGSPDGGEILKETMVGNDPVQLGKQLAEKLIGLGADRILSEAKRRVT